MTRTTDFIQWFGDSIALNDCDPALFMTTYFFNRFEYNKEQQYWLCWLYGNTYNWPSAYAIWNEFPDFALVDQNRLEKWNSENYKRLRYQTDTKWNKGHLPAMFKSYRENVMKFGSQQAFFDNYCDGTPEENFDKLYNKIVNDFFKFGRYMTWFYLQILKQCAGVNINPKTLLLSDPGSESHRNGFLYAVGKDDWTERKISKEEYEKLEQIASNILRATKQRYPDHADKIDYFAMETCLCAWKKVFRNYSTRWIGYYLARQKQEIENAEKDGWIGINWEPLWQCRTEILKNANLCEHSLENINKSKFEEVGKIKYWNEMENKVDNLSDFFT